jgi:hypothetical protein
MGQRADWVVLSLPHSGSAWYPLATPVPRTTVRYYSTLNRSASVGFGVAALAGIAPTGGFTARVGFRSAVKRALFPRSMDFMDMPRSANFRFPRYSRRCAAE